MNRDGRKKIGWADDIELKDMERKGLLNGWVARIDIRGLTVLVAWQYKPFYCSSDTVLLERTDQYTLADESIGARKSKNMTTHLFNY